MLTLRTERVLLILCVAISGCAGTEDYQYRCLNRLRAVCAWREAPSPYADSCFASDFACGWREGYYEVSAGGSGEPPPVPPEEYWSTHYQNCEGQQAIEAWYRGYQEGAIAAEQSGRREWNYVPGYQAPRIFPSWGPDTPTLTPPQFEPVPLEPPPGEFPGGDAIQP